MPSATGKAYGNGLLHLLDATAPWNSDDWYLGIVTSAYTVDIDAHEFWSTPAANEVSTGSGYSAGGYQADSEALSLVTANNDVEFDLANESAPTVTFTDGKHLIIYSRTPATDATRELAFYATFDTALAPQGGTLDINFASTGVVLIDYT